MDPKTIAEGIPEEDRKAVWHALGEMLHGKGGAHTNDTSGGTRPPPPPPGDDG